MSPIVTVKKNQRLLAQAEAIDLLDVTTDAFVHVLDHVGKVFGVFLKSHRWN